MKIANYIPLLTAPLLTGLLSACAGDDSLLDGIFPVGKGDVISIGGIDNTVVETSLGGYTPQAAPASRATGDTPSVDAETVDWLLGPLFGGLDITYGAKDQPETERVAILRLLKADETAGETAENIKFSTYVGPNDERIAEYSFKYHNGDGTEGTDAKWYDNGLHYFQGVFVPQKLRFSAVSETPETVNDPTNGKAPALKLDQSKDSQNSSNPDANYTLLERYLGMPADANIYATVARVKLPFRHRLARVQAYVLIDPTMGSDVTIKGYKKAADGITDVATEDAATSDIRFCNVKVLSGVKETSDASISGHAQLTPIWDQQRKVTPHFVAERTSINSLGETTDADNFIMFYDTELKTYIFPANDEAWAKAKAAWDNAYTQALGAGTSDEDKSKAADIADTNSGYKRTLYGRVPCYDLIVRPTYTTGDMVMYDEDLGSNSKEQFAAVSNLIDFEITLNNGLQYYKEFKFDLDANYETIVYLRINRESIDYNSSGAEIWDEELSHDGYYGVNNQNGNTLSYAGSSWQRAYRIGSTNPGVTDGHYYGQDDSSDDNAVQDDDTMPWYPQYVDQPKWTEMFAEAYMDPTTGKKGLHHGDYFILDKDITIDARLLPDNFVFTGHLDGQDHTITLTNGGENWYEDHYTYDASTNYGASPLYVLQDGEYVVFNLPTLYTYTPAVLYTEETAATENASHLIADSEGKKPGDDGYTPTYQGGYSPVHSGDVQTAEHYDLSHPTLALVKEGTTTYYTKSNDVYTAYSAPTVYEYVNHPIPHTSGTTLFAGLNGAYPAAIGEANVHSENGKIVPYVDSTTGTGWRAEVINTKIAGADMFPADAIDNGHYVVSKVSGYIYNCWQMNADNTKTAIKPHTPTLPKYK